MEKTNDRRVKVYKLNEDGQWADQGTGYVTIVETENVSPVIFVVSEDDEKVMLLKSRISKEDIYKRQQDTLIVWNQVKDEESEAEDTEDLALSFQEPSGCHEIWEELRNHQIQMGSEQMPNDLGSGFGFIDEHYAELSNTKAVELPAANIKSLDEIATVISSGTYAMRKDKIAKALLENEGDYLKKLFDLFHILEDLDAKEDLGKIFKIFTSIVLLNNPAIYDFVFADENIFDLLGALEYDPELNKTTKHRDFVKNKAKFNQVIEFGDPVIVNQIHLTFRLQYIKDVILARVLDEGTFSTLGSLVIINNCQIAAKVSTDAAFLTKLFVRMKSSSTPQDTLVDLVKLLLSLCDLVKTLELRSITAFYRALNDRGLYDVLAKTLKNPDKSVRLNSIEIMSHSIENDSTLIRTHISNHHKAESTPEGSLLYILIERLDKDPESGVKILVNDAIKLIIDAAEGNEEMYDGNQDFVDKFYTMYMKFVIAPILRKLPPGGVHSETEGLTKNLTLDLLTHLVRRHDYRVKQYLLGQNIPTKVIALLGSREKFLILSALRFFRAIVHEVDKYYSNHIMKMNLFAPIVDLFIANGSKYNLLNSAILELFEHIKKTNNKPLVKHVIENFAPKLEHVDYVSTFKSLKTRYEQNEYSEQNKPDASTSSYKDRGGKKQPSWDIDEDDKFFDREDDDEDATPPEAMEPEVRNNASKPSVLGNLVAYGDSDSDDEDFTPEAEKNEKERDGLGGEVNMKKRKSTEISTSGSAMDENTNGAPPPSKRLKPDRNKT